MADTFRNDVERIQRLIQQIRGDIQKREQKINGNQPVGMIDGEIRGGITKLEREIELLRTLVDRQTNNQEVMQKESESRRNKLLELQNVAVELKSTFDRSLKSQQDQLFNNRSGSGKMQYRDTEAVQQMDNKQLYQNQKQLQKDQDAKLDVAIDQLDTLKNTGKGIKNTLDEQNKLLDQVDADMDKTNKDMIKVNGKLQKFLKTSSYCCLWTFIFFEVVGLILIFVLL